ncbi:PREDICTED: uncharacterized protein LOC109223574 [Nicotiana attenuata]|uniref:Uncharacterized protein n=1 Tax=Nicotiana attenuata TaxID=49451 RepID=A0A1J6IKC3_NICAT|nr:PREDICTED: uncharacterized protein LOC109223574 [Nicotiana attenuata]XP_019243485.1 PREDICTED: uncharacterized protein LOC109223574 [Nicotiana attenuata]XP_019243486.1 PREDICTED: uncharacterized protein LOC109223574 [Nicotiana attenuata]XP_019243487.1 PREDICTED: uncharacterized protein LOC109223574 [Nicotiana attenuata]XP_019243488.1 PREDICTED: uncharacterized protein LOC109223574 [Nicotiana attenuata]XP_019243489.1 PREDICTED: uncharacterized protein LOC109223574 [Nicotiana attenuata]XP_01
MRCILRRSGSIIQKDPDMDDSTLSLKSLEDYGVSSVIWRFSNCRSTDVTFFVLASNGLWRVLVLPQQYLYREICRRSLQSNVNSFQAGSLLPLTSFLLGSEKIQRVFNIGSPLESISSRSSLHDGGAFRNLKKWDMLSIIPSGQNPVIECEFPGTISRGSDANSVEDMDVHDPKENRSTDRFSRKKPRKKGKRNRNLNCSNGLNELQSAVGCSITQAAVQSIQHRSISSSANMSNSLMTDGMTVSSFALGSSSDERCCSGGCKSPHSIVRTEVSSTGDMLNSAGEKKKRSKQHVGNPYVTEKKDKYIRRVPKDSNVYASSTGNQNSHARKENYHCIWKRVQKNDADVSNCDLEKLNLGYSQFDDRLKKSTLKKELPNRVDSIILSQSAHENQEKLKVPKNPRRNKCRNPLEENESQYRKGSPVNGACSNVCLKTNMQSDDVFGSATQIATAKRSINAADSQTGTTNFRARHKKRNVQYVSLKAIPNPQACSRNVEATENVPIIVSCVDDQTVEHQFDLLSRSEKFNDLTEQRRELPAVDGEGDKTDKEVSPSCQNVTQEQLASKCQALVSSSVNVRVINAGENSENIKVLPGDTQFEKLRNHNTCTLEQGYENAAMAKFFVPEAKSQPFHSLENDWRNISQAVNDAHSAELASKAIEIGKGYPAAEFEKLLHSASPFICPSVSIRTCQACFLSRANAPLCRHEIPNISLENLWQWYEKHGSYGLEVKAEDHRNARQYGMDHFKFRAYFVPYLSAIQLFEDHRTRPIHNDNRTLGSMDVVDWKTNKISESSPSVDLGSIFSVLVPQPLVEDSSSLQKGVVSGSGSSSECSNGDLHHLSNDINLSDDVELLFEYFESEQPQRRRPLFETIHELVSGNGPSNSRSYGDPSLLHTASLHDLHPHSWFSVAWYPIYRIPDGNLRAAFLTYHSLGHFIHRDQTLKSCSVDDCIVSPIIGLQSYNAQGECWFQPRHSADDLTEEFLDMDLHTVLRERIRTLEQTASIMSRAVRKIGSDTLVNRHPDYEFFLSRRR